MFKHIFIILLLSFIVIFFLRELDYVIHLIMYAHHYLVNLLQKIITHGRAGVWIRNSLALFLIPLIVALIPTAIYSLIIKKEFKYFPHVFWVSWIVLATILATR